MMRLVAVIGPGSCSEEEWGRAFDVGAEIARRGLGVVCGGLGGAMEAACRGCAAFGGECVGILPGTDPSEGNPYLSFAIPTGMGEGRNVLVVRAGAGAIAVGGEYGTLSEIALALKLGKPVVTLGGWSLQHPSGLGERLLRADSAAEAVELLLGALEGS